ncbi:hypothetical protein HK096_004634, partial [Nowakowskiella sp. JEL0078]
MVTIGLDVDDTKTSTTLSTRPINSDFIALGTEILDRLRNHASSAPFILPVDDTTAPGYSSRIKRPMDLTTLAKNLKDGVYGNELEAFANDIRRIFFNCYTYNIDDSGVFKQSKKLELFFEKDIFPLAISGKLLNPDPIISVEPLELGLSESLDEQSLKTEDVKTKPSSTPVPKIKLALKVGSSSMTPLKVGSNSATSTSLKVNSGWSSPPKVGLASPTPCVTPTTISDKIKLGKVPPEVKEPTPTPHIPVVTLSNKSVMSASETKKCKSVLKIVQKHPVAGWFLEPVDPVLHGLPTYFEIVKKPMDLSTVKSKLERGLYSSPKDFESDMQLVFENAMLFNYPDSAVYKDTIVVKKFFQEEFQKEFRPQSLSSQIPVIQNIEERPLKILKMGSDNSKHCERILEILFALQASESFKAPVDPVQVPLYRTIIKHPMDLKTIKTKLEADKYLDHNEFEADIRLVISNCNTFNIKGSWICTQVDELEAVFNKEWWHYYPISKPVKAEQQPEKVTGMPKVSISTAVTPLKDTNDGRKCRKILDSLNSHNDALWFRLPVDPIGQGVPTYPDIIKYPMDLSKVSERLDLGKYTSQTEFQNDIRLMFDNCYTFNVSSVSEVFVAGKNLENYFNDLLTSSGFSVIKEFENLEFTKKPKSKDVKERKSATPSTLSQQLTEAERASIRKIIDTMFAQEYSIYFRYPVDDAILPDYKQRIKNPIDLSTMITKLEPTSPKAYQTTKDFENDIKLLFANCYSYNVKNTQGHTFGQELERFFKREWRTSFNTAPAPSTPLRPDIPKNISTISGRPNIKLSIASGGSSETIAETDKRRCLQVLDTLSAHNFASWFLQPVPRTVPGYHVVIKRPMDLGTVRRRLLSGKYSVDSFTGDIEQIWKNCQQFNQEVGS